MPIYETVPVREQAGGALLTDTVGQPRPKGPAGAGPQAQGMMLPPPQAQPPGLQAQQPGPQTQQPGPQAQPPGPQGAPAVGAGGPQQPLEAGGAPLGQVDPNLARWNLGNDPWAVMNLIAGDARTRSEVQDRLNNFLRMPTGQAMPQHIRNAVRAMGFQVLDQDNPADGRAEVNPMTMGGMRPVHQEKEPSAGMAPLPPEAGPVRETMGMVQNPDLPSARPPEEGQWVSMNHAGVPLVLYITPGGTVIKGPAALIGANVKHLNPLSGERHMIFHPPGHIPPLADAQHTYSEHPHGSLPLRLKRQDSQLALVQALHDVASQANGAKKGQADSQNAAVAAQMRRQGAVASPGKFDTTQGKDFQSGPLPLSGTGDRGADNPMAGAETHASPEPSDVLAASGSAAKSADSSPHAQEKVPSTGLFPENAGRSAGSPQEAGTPGAGPEQASEEDQDLVPPVHKMQPWLMDHVLSHQGTLEEMGRPNQPNEVAHALGESATPPEQVLALAHYMHLWHPHEGPPEEKVAHLGATVEDALERAHGAGAIRPHDRTAYQESMGHLVDFVRHHGRFPSHREFATHLYGRTPAPTSGDVTGQGASYGERPQAPGY